MQIRDVEQEHSWPGGWKASDALGLIAHQLRVNLLPLKTIFMNRISIGNLLLCVILFGSCSTRNRMVECDCLPYNYYHINPKVIAVAKEYIDEYNSTISTGKGILPYLSILPNVDSTIFILSAVSNTKVITDGNCDGFVLIDSQTVLLLNLFDKNLLIRDSFMINCILDKTVKYLTQDSISSFTFNPPVWKICIQEDTIIKGIYQGNLNRNVKKVIPLQKFSPP